MINFKDKMWDVLTGLALIKMGTTGKCLWTEPSNSRKPTTFPENSGHTVFIDADVPNISQFAR